MPVDWFCVLSQVTGQTALIEAIRGGAMELVRAILKKGGNVNAVDKKGFHAAHFASERGFIEVSATQVCYYI